VEGIVREVKRRVRVVASSCRDIDRSVTRWIVVTMVEWSSEVRWELVKFTVTLHEKSPLLGHLTVLSYSLSHSSTLW